MKKQLFKLISCISALSLLVLVIPTSAIGVLNKTNLQVTRMNNVFAQKIEEIQPDNPTDRVNITNFVTRQLKDFSGNLYTLVECEPNGYLIYHDESGILLSLHCIVRLHINHLLEHYITGDQRVTMRRLKMA